MRTLVFLLIVLCKVRCCVVESFSAMVPDTSFNYVIDSGEFK